jgi:hypothetical protein
VERPILPACAPAPSAEAQPPAADPKKPLAAGAPFSGTYAVTTIVKAGGETEVASGTQGCDVKDCLIRRRSYAFEGTKLRIRYLLVAMADHSNDFAMTTVCDAQTTVDVSWDGEAMVLGTTVVAKANTDVHRRKQQKTGPDKWKVDWESDHLGCSATLRAGRYVVADVSKEQRDGRPAKLVLKSPEQTHQLEAVDQDVDVKEAINDFYGQRAK